ELRAFMAECDRLGTSEEAIERAEKKGFDTGLKVRHPLDSSRTLPLYVANFVLYEYGTGAIFGCAAHDQRDLDVPRRYAPPVRPVVQREVVDGETYQIDDQARAEDGRVINAGFLEGRSVPEAERAIVQKLEQMVAGAAT